MRRDFVWFADNIIKIYLLSLKFLRKQEIKKKRIRKEIIFSALPTELRRLMNAPRFGLVSGEHNQDIFIVTLIFKKTRD